MSFCPNCGYKIVDDEIAYCPKCGNRFKVRCYRNEKIRVEVIRNK